jgi:hypothetical protein
LTATAARFEGGRKLVTGVQFLAFRLMATPERPFRPGP